jgi:hypothetical protein
MVGVTGSIPVAPTIFSGTSGFFSSENVALFRLFCLRTFAKETGPSQLIAVLAHRLKFNVCRPIHIWIDLSCLQPDLFAGMAPSQQRGFRLVEVESHWLTGVDRDGNMDADKGRTCQAMLTAIDLVHDLTSHSSVGSAARSSEPVSMNIGRTSRISPPKFNQLFSTRQLSRHGRGHRFDPCRTHHPFLDLIVLDGAIFRGGKARVVIYCLAIPAPSY